jgi:hypothetical protein
MAGLAALTAFALNEFADAVPLAQKAVELDPRNPWPTRLLANLYFDLADEQKFLVTVEQAEARWPKDSPLSTGIRETRPD